MKNVWNVVAKKTWQNCIVIVLVLSVQTCETLSRLKGPSTSGLTVFHWSFLLSQYTSWTSFTLRQRSLLCVKHFFNWSHVVINAYVRFLLFFASCPFVCIMSLNCSAYWMSLQLSNHPINSALSHVFFNATASKNCKSYGVSNCRPGFFSITL